MWLINWVHRIDDIELDPPNLSYSYRSSRQDKYFFTTLCSIFHFMLTIKWAFRKHILKLPLIYHKIGATVRILDSKCCKKGWFPLRPQLPQWRQSWSHYEIKYNVDNTQTIGHNPQITSISNQQYNRSLSVNHKDTSSSNDSQKTVNVSLFIQA